MDTNSAAPAPEEWVRNVVREAALAVLPYCDLGADLKAGAERMANRIAKERAPVVRVSDEDRTRLAAIREDVESAFRRCEKCVARFSDRFPNWAEQRDEYVKQLALLDRLLATGTAP